MAAFGDVRAAFTVVAAFRDFRAAFLACGSLLTQSTLARLRIASCGLQKSQGTSCDTRFTCVQLVTTRYNIARSCQHAPLSDRQILKQGVHQAFPSVIWWPHSCFLLRIPDASRVAARETLCDATMAYHSATQNCICKPAGNPTLLWEGPFVFDGSLVVCNHLTHSTAAVKVEHGRTDDGLCDVLITYPGAMQHCICEPAGDPKLLWVGAFVFGAFFVLWHHLTHSRTAVKVEYGIVDDKLCDVLITYHSAPHRLQAKAFSKLRTAAYFHSFCICKKVNSVCQFSCTKGSAQPAGMSCDTQMRITEHTSAGPQCSGLSKCLSNIL